MAPRDADCASASGWLMEHGSPVIRYRVAREFLSSSESTLVSLRGALLATSTVQMWLARLSFGRIHNGKNTDFENVIHKLVELGLHRGIPELDERVAPYLAWLDTGQSERGMMAVLNRSIVLGGLSRAGYAECAPVRRHLLERLGQLAAATKGRDYDIYRSPTECLDLPKAMRHRYPVLKAGFAPDGELHLPYIHDLYALSCLPDSWMTATVTSQSEAVLRYVLVPQYQSLHRHYGYVRVEQNGRPRFYVLGWDARLPESGSRCMVQRLELMAHFPLARNHPWFRRSLAELQGFRTNEGTYLLPRSLLCESKEGYWVCGALMGLEPRRSTARALEVESTFRVLRIQRLLKGK